MGLDQLSVDPGKFSITITLPRALDGSRAFRFVEYFHDVHHVDREVARELAVIRADLPRLAA